MVGNKMKMFMEKYFKAWAVVSMLLLSTSCTDDEIIETITPAEDGSEIIFGARAGFENSNPQSRTEYSGIDYTYNGKTYERVDWVFNTDKVEIFCPEGANTKTSHYVVKNASINADTPSTDEDGNKTTETDHLNDYAYLQRIGDSSIQWNGDGNHNFYAMYPSSMMFTEDPSKTLETGVYLNGTTVTGIVPFSQQPLKIEGDGNYVVVPNMDYAYMVAKSQATRKDGTVSLSFVPIVTAVEMTLQYPSNGTETIYIGEIQVTSKTAITGKFTTDLSKWNPESGYPNCENDSENTVETIQITTRKKDEKGIYKPLELKQGGSLTFTVFLLPGTDVNNLIIRLSDTGAGYASKTMDFSNNLIKKNIKNIVTGVNLPSPLVVDASNWMLRIADDAPMGRLSIPGTGNSFSNLSTEDDYYKSQLISFEQQWNLGIRAFEITCDRPTEGTTSLGGKAVMCNSLPVGSLTVRGAFDLILDTDDDEDSSDGLIGPNSTETAMVILTYQPGGGTSDPNRNPGVFMNSLNVLYDELVKTYGNRFVLYSPELTMDEARGNVMIVARPTQIDEDDATSRSTALTAIGNRNILVVDGCGTGKDKWGRRGYKVKVGEEFKIAADIKDCKTGAPLLESYLIGTYQAWGSSNNLNSTTWADWTGNVTVGTISTCDFSYRTQSDTYKIWFQEWARIAESDLKIKLSDTSLGIYTWHYNCWWRESYNEKKNAVIKTFDMAISDQYKSTHVFINSLCGYFIDSTEPLSYAPYMNNPADLDFSYWPVGGKCGKIGDLATILNRDFYNHVLDSGFENETGPTGVVLMERLSTSASDGGSHYLPGTIIANNFKYGSASDNLGGSGDGSEDGGEG